MIKSNSQKYIIAFLLFTGICFRLSLFYISTPNTFYDDHMQVIHMYAQSFERPAPFSCWECYQPPAYYYIGAVVFKLSQFSGLQVKECWKMVQLINPILAILVLIFFYSILREIGATDKQKILYLSFMLVLPRDLFTSAMIGNDYLLTFSAIAAAFYYVKCLKYFASGSLKDVFITYLKLAFFTALGCLAKQHGILLLLLPASISVIFFIKEKRFALARLAPVLLLITVLALSEVYWQYKQTGYFLASNQHHFDGAKHQFPGSLDKVEFLTFRIVELFKNPFLSPTTAASLPTELFARTFFDYEWKFLPPDFELSKYVGRLAYVLGLCWMLYFVLTTIGWIRRKSRNGIRWDQRTCSFLVLLILAMLFVAVPVIQTIRFPYFSSMKAMFMLPGIIVILAIHPLLVKDSRLFSRVCLFLTGFNILYGLILLIAIFLLFEVSEYWYFPK